MCPERFLSIWSLVQWTQSVLVHSDRFSDPTILFSVSKMWSLRKYLHSISCKIYGDLLSPLSRQTGIKFINKIPSNSDPPTAIMTLYLSSF